MQLINLKKIPPAFRHENHFNLIKQYKEKINE